MMELLTNPAFLALLGTILGGVGLKVVEHLLQRSKTEVDLAAALRKELRDEVNTLRAELKAVEKDLDDWKAKYYALMQDLFNCKGEFAELDKVLKSALDANKQFMEAKRSLEDEKQNEV